MAEIRLNKWLAEAMGVSRREADEMIAAGRIIVAGKVATLGDKVTPTSEVYADGAEVKTLAENTYLALNKPVGYVSSRKAQGDAPTLYELLPEEYRTLKTVGRLDKDSSGLILLTDDGDFAHKMTHPSFQKTKIYEVGLDRTLEPLHQQMISDYGLQLKDGVSKMGLEKVSEDRRAWRVSLGEGRNRQIRRTFGALGYTVERLHRTQFGKYMLGGLKSGKWEKVQEL